MSIEKHPFHAHDLLAWHARDPALLPLASSLAAAWPMLTPGLHRVELDRQRVILTLVFGDFAAALANPR